MTGLFAVNLKNLCVLVGQQNGYTYFRVSCVCGIVGLAKSIGLRKIVQREKDLRLGKKYYTLSFDLSKLCATSSSPYQTRVDGTVFK